MTSLAIIYECDKKWSCSRGISMARSFFLGYIYISEILDNFRLLCTVVFTLSYAVYCQKYFGMKWYKNK